MPQANMANPRAEIGPNAILQLLPLIERLGGPARVEQMLARAGIFAAPSEDHMIPEGLAARLHRQLRTEEKTLAPALAHEAGLATGRYILANRIPKPAQLMLNCLPAGPAAFLLTLAIMKHAWTFAGSGTFSAPSPWVFEIAHNPLVPGEQSELCLSDWHAGVFTQLYRALVAPDCHCAETRCCARNGDDACRFEITRRA